MATDFKVLQCCSIIPEVDTLFSNIPNVALTFKPSVSTCSAEDLIKEAKGYHCIIINLSMKITREVITALSPTLRLISTYSVGHNHIDTQAAKDCGVRVSNTPGVLTEATADLAFSLLLSTARRTPQAHAHTLSGQFSGWSAGAFMGVPVFGKTLGVIGMGRIGTAIAHRGRGFNMSVIYHNRSPAPAEEALSASRVGLDELLRTADFVVLACPLTEETRGLIGIDQMKIMKPTSVLINIARGACVKEGELVEALSTGVIWGAGLDVYEREPEVHPGLFGLDNCVLLPHLGSSTLACRLQMGELVCAAVSGVQTGKAEELDNLVC
eukprot:gnl/Dysnectes_brevis/6562_a10274_439.p1 GENE.gnl/Dysnectes_brevis/6562_a10274_439~~gnl/Dysnectes_brevis/6562_a10274_439.p1  ORF type:complete len:325 (-),score=72.64 gnl/Dysnectes_brevis/6562_a10274_439:74-1048(-)